MYMLVVKVYLEKFAGKHQEVGDIVVVKGVANGTELLLAAGPSLLVRIFDALRAMPESVHIVKERGGVLSVGGRLFSRPNGE